MDSGGGLTVHPLENEALPELRSTYHDSFGGSGGFMGPGHVKRFNQSDKNVALHGAPSPRTSVDASRLHYIEDRLANQEQTSKNFLDKAMRIKEDLIENMNLTHSTWQGEKNHRELLQRHIHTITEIVHKLDKDIMGFQDQLKVKDAYMASNTNAIKSIEIQQATTVTDMRGRIARCDAAISKLAADQQRGNEDIKLSSSRQQDSIQRLHDKIQALELKLVSKQQAERNVTETATRVQNGNSSSARHTAVCDSRLKASVEEVKLLLANQKHGEASQREKSINRLQAELAKQEAAYQSRLDKIEQKLENALHNLELQVKGIQMATDMEELKQRQTDLETKVTAVMDRSLNQQLVFFNRLKQECRQGFATVHESITNSKQVLEGKLLLSEEQLRKEISHVRKMVVLV